VTFVDEFSKKIYIFFMKNKDEVFSRFQEFMAQVENQTCKRIIVLSSDNGGEYTYNYFNYFCKEVGSRGS
jgi:hypothetical protein